MGWLNKIKGLFTKAKRTTVGKTLIRHGKKKADQLARRNFGKKYSMAKRGYDIGRRGYENVKKHGKKKGAIKTFAESGLLDHIAKGVSKTKYGQKYSHRIEAGKKLGIDYLHQKSKIPANYKQSKKKPRMIGMPNPFSQKRKTPQLGGGGMPGGGGGGIRRMPGAGGGGIRH